jgi:hypothetical protein
MRPPASGYLTLTSISPLEHVELWIHAVTGTEYDFVTRQVKTLEPERWHVMKEHYEKIAVEHAKICKYPDANQWLHLQGEPGR